MPVAEKYGQLTWLETITLPLTLLKLPFALSRALIASPFEAQNKQKSWRRVLAEQMFRWAGDLTVAQIQKLNGTTEETYHKAVFKFGLQPVVEDLGENAKLLWLGPKRTERVLLYIHGGAFILPPPASSLQFWRYVHQKLESRTPDSDVGFAMLNYTLIPDAGFPTPLRQAVRAIEHILASGVQPSSLQLTGDSAGGNLVMQVLLHALHPVDGVPPLQLPVPFRGACLISPWALLEGHARSRTENNDQDIVSAKTVAYWGSLVLADVPSAQRGYVEASQAPEAWFTGLDRVVERVLITAGGVECLKDDIVQLSQTLKKHHPKVDLAVQAGGVHCDMALDFMIGVPEEQLGELVPMCIQWFAEGLEP